jgi:hypothetical protein
MRQPPHFDSGAGRQSGSDTRTTRFIVITPKRVASPNCRAALVELVKHAAQLTSIVVYRKTNI